MGITVTFFFAHVSRDCSWYSAKGKHTRTTTASSLTKNTNESLDGMQARKLVDVIVTRNTVGWHCRSIKKPARKLWIYLRNYCTVTHFRFKKTSPNHWVIKNLVNSQIKMKACKDNKKSTTVTPLLEIRERTECSIRLATTTTAQQQQRHYWLDVNTPKCRNPEVMKSRNANIRHT